MAKPKSKISEITDPRTGKKITVAFDPKVPPKGKAKLVYDAKAHANADKNLQKEQKIPFTVSEAPKLKDIEQKVLDFLSSLDHPATSNEVRDKFGFKLRADARRIFKKLANLGYGENRKVGNKYLFHVKGKEYPPPPVPEPKAEPPKTEETKEK